MVTRTVPNVYLQQSCSSHVVTARVCRAYPGKSIPRDLFFNVGQLKVHSRGLAWKKQGGGKAVEVDTSEIAHITWMKVPRSNHLGVQIKDGLKYKFVGFRDQQAFEVSLADVSQTQLQGKNDVILEFHVDNTTVANEVFREKIMSMADVGSGGEEAVVTFDTITILAPRGRYNIELHLSLLRLQGQATDFKIQYSSIVRVFVLPKSNQPHTFVVVTLDPPIRKGQTMYPHIVMQFETDYVVESTLVMNADLYATKYKDKLEPSYKGLIHEVFTMILHGLSGTKTTRPGNSVVVRMVML
ncbi:FACT complex subunit SSRP1 [Artemisia annua]|uniref:FACT complex subunit SSRP1 n=1 Tax=Artemisia annua TaxID=35608 RepID=A0A2U1Q4E4_ARTAN|nr:FACT complex subunit SSRP1 [Artemisia annua]